MRSMIWLAAALIALATAPALAQTAPVETVVVIAPLPGASIDADKIPGEVQALSLSDLTRDRQSDVLPSAIASQLSSVSLNDEQGSQFQPDFVYRGFEASPISGVAEGIAVYQNGVRINEAFGDSVNWDLVPQFAVDGFVLQSNNPVFGLNAIGGAVSLTMKDGFNADGADAQLSGGSFGNVAGSAEYGARFGKFGVYFGIGAVDDDGFRYHSPTKLRQAYGDMGYEDGPLELHVSVSGAQNGIAAVGPTPVELLAQDRRAVFTHPQSIRNQMALGQVRAAYRASDVLNLSADVYARHFDQHLVDGNTTDIDYCGNDPAELCLEGNNDFPGDALYDSHGDPVPASALPPGATPGETDFTRTNSNTVGLAAQASLTAPLAGLANNLVVGASFDRGTTSYNAHGELGALLDNLDVAGSGVIIDQAFSPSAQPPLEEPVDVRARNDYTGIYAIDALDIAPGLAWTVSGRFNGASVSLTDRLGNALNGRHDFNRLNPGTGVTYKLGERLTAYAGYSQANRAPTAGELSCANPASPCLLDAFLVSDPPLKQVVSTNFEFGLRGGFDLTMLPGTFSWNAGAYRTDNRRDILLLATDINGFGYFQNAGTTRHQGVDLRLGYRGDRWTVAASYSLLDATFRNAQILSSNSPGAVNGLIQVEPGDRLPLDPRSRFTFTVDFAATAEWTIGADLRAQSGQYLAGDEANQEPKLPGFTTIDLHSAYQLGPNLALFGEIENLADAKVYTYGAFTELDGLPPNFSLTNPRTYSPAPGRTFFSGLRLHI